MTAGVVQEMEMNGDGGKHNLDGWKCILDDGRIGPDGGTECGFC
jgi:hypothetical protein